MTCGLTLFDRQLNKAFYKLGFVIGNRPWTFIAFSILLALLFITGFQKINYQMDPEYLFSPVGGDGKIERALVEKYFPMNYSSQFNVGRITRAGRFGRVIIVAKDGIRNMLRASVWHELRILNGYVQNLTVQFDDEYFTYKDICARWQNDCFENDILNLDSIIEDVENKKINLTFPVMINPITWDAHIFPVFFGGSIIDKDRFIELVPSLQLVYFMKADTSRQRARGAVWEDQFLDLMGNLENSTTFKHISISRFSSRTLDHELERNTQTVIPYIGLTFVLMVLFSTLTSLMTDWVRSKPYLGVLGVVSSTIATLAAFGFCMYLGVDFIGLNLAAPFLLIGVGIDDTFVMLSAWRRTSIKETVPIRVAKMLSEASVSVTITSLTDMLSFFIGVTSTFPSVQIFCFYSAVSIAFLYCCHLTFFTACIAISGYCEESNRHGLLCFKVQPLSKSGNRSWFYRNFCSGGIDPADPDNPLDNREHIIMVFFRDQFAPFLNRKLVKIFVIVAFVGYLMGACYGITQIEEGLDRRKVAKPDSYSIEFFNREDLYYREFPYRIQVILTGDYNYSDVKTQFQIENLTRHFESTSYVSGSQYTESWLRSFLVYVEQNKDFLNISIDSEEKLIQSLKQNWLFPENTLSLDVKFNENNTRILASRFLIQAVNISDTNHEKEMVRALRNICKDSPLNVTIFHPYFVYFDQFELVRPTAINSMIVGGLIMMIVSFIMIPNVMCSFWVAFSIISIEMGVLGYMSLWDISLDSISMINLIMCIGFSVDFTAHICYAYMSSKEKTSDEKVRDCLFTLGYPIVQAATSTIVGVVGLLLANSYLFLVFFKMIFLVIFFGALHGLFLLPVLLSLFGPSGRSSSSSSSSSSKINQHNFSNFTEIEKNDKKSLPVYRRRSFQDFDDLGLGTSCEVSSQSSSNNSQKREKRYNTTTTTTTTTTTNPPTSNVTIANSLRKQIEPDARTRQKYEERWRKSTQNLVAFYDSNPKMNFWIANAPAAAAAADQETNREQTIRVTTITKPHKSQLPIEYDCGYVIGNRSHHRFSMPIRSYSFHNTHNSNN